MDINLLLIDPVAFQLGPIAVRWYVVLVLTVLIRLHR